MGAQADRKVQLFQIGSNRAEPVQTGSDGVHGAAAVAAGLESVLAVPGGLGEGVIGSYRIL